MLNHELLEKNLKKVKMARFCIIIISIVVCFTFFLIRDCSGQKWADYILFLFPYISTLSYSCVKQHFLKSKLFVSNKDDKPQPIEILESVNDSIVVIIKYLKL